MRYHCLTVAALLFAAFGFSGWSYSHAEEVVLITNASNPASQISKRQLRAIFSMRMKVWSNNDSIKVFVLQQDNPIHASFSKDVLKVFPHQLQAGWDRLVFSGTGEAPKVVNSETEMLEAIQSTPGAIGYISATYISSKVQTDDSVHTLSIE